MFVDGVGFLAPGLDDWAQARAALTSERDEFSEFDEGVLIPELGRECVVARHRGGQ